MINGYMRLLMKRPLLTKSLTAYFLMSTGDRICQSIEGKSFDFKRNVRFGLYGLLLQAPWRHFAYDVIMPKYVPGNSFVDIAKKMLFSQTIFAVVMFSQFFIFMGMLEGKTLN